MSAAGPRKAWETPDLPRGSPAACSLRQVERRPVSRVVFRKFVKAGGLARRVTGAPRDLLVCPRCVLRWTSSEEDDMWVVSHLCC